VPKSADTRDVEAYADVGGGTGEGARTGKRRLFGFGKRKRKEDDKSKLKKSDDPTPVEAGSENMTPIVHSPPPHSNHPYLPPSSPQRNLYSSSPRIASPAGSQIFERDVQESTLTVPNSPAIPSHIQTENHIPPVLDASSEAITNNKLDPDTVEIVMHASHQPAAVTVTGVGSSEGAGNWADDSPSHPDKDDAASNYGVLDGSDIRRLSFISFSDIVQSEHAEHAGNRDSVYVAGIGSLSSPGHRSPSPIRSPVSSQGFSTSTPTSKSASIKGLELSPRKPLGSPVSAHAPINGGELTIETMSQALRRTGSGDFGGNPSQPLSPSSPDGISDRSFK